MKRFVIIHDWKCGPNPESHILVAERDYTYIDFAVKYRVWDGKVTKDTLTYETEEMAWSIIENYMISCTPDAPSKEEQLKDFWLEEVEVPNE